MQGRDLGYKIFYGCFYNPNGPEESNQPASARLKSSRKFIYSGRFNFITCTQTNLATRTDPIRLAVPRKGEIKRFLVTLTVWKWMVDWVKKSTWLFCCFPRNFFTVRLQEFFVET